MELLFSFIIRICFDCVTKVLKLLYCVCVKDIIMALPSLKYVLIKMCYFSASFLQLCRTAQMLITNAFVKLFYFNLLVIYYQVEVTCKDLDTVVSFIIYRH